MDLTGSPPYSQYPTLASNKMPFLSLYTQLGNVTIFKSPNSRVNQHYNKEI